MKKLIILFVVIAVYATSSFAFTYSTGLKSLTTSFGTASGYFNTNGVYVELNSPNSVYPLSSQNEMYVTCTLYSQAYAKTTLTAGERWGNIYPWGVEQYVTIAAPNYYSSYLIEWQNPGTYPQSYRLSWN